jgi:hypothetical protein
MFVCFHAHKNGSILINAYHEVYLDTCALLFSFSNSKLFHVLPPSVKKKLSNERVNEITFVIVCSISFMTIFFLGQLPFHVIFTVISHNFTEHTGGNEDLKATLILFSCFI